MKINHQNVYFTADPHFGHNSIRKYCNRPFDSVEEMNESIRDNFKAPGAAELFVIGDVFFRLTTLELIHILHQLAEWKHVHFIRGNHDKKRHFSLIRQAWPSGKRNYTIHEDSIVEVFIADDEMEQAARIILCHYPLLSWNASYHGSWHLFGHTHATLKHPSFNAIDVGVDNWNYTPISYQTVKETITMQNLHKKHYYGK